MTYIVEEIKYWLCVYVARPIISVLQGLCSLCNLRRYHRVIYGHRWWDYGSMLEVVDKMLEEREQYWVKKTHYVGDRFTLGRIKVLRRMYREYSTSDTWDDYVLLRRYLSRFARVAPRLWN